MVRWARATPRGPADGAADSGTPGGHCWVPWTSWAGARRRLGVLGSLRPPEHLRPGPRPLPTPNHRGSGWEAPRRWFSPCLCLSCWRLSLHPSLAFFPLSVSPFLAVCLCLCALCFFCISSLSLFSLPSPALPVFSPVLHPSLLSFIFVSCPQPPPRLHFPLPAISCQFAKSYMSLKRKKGKKNIKTQKSQNKNKS